MINVIINGINGRMGQIIKENIATQSDFCLVAGTNRQDDLMATIKMKKADVVIDFTVPSAVFSNTKTIINSGARPVIGTTGLTVEQINILSQQCQIKKIGGIIAPNFFLGAVLMIKYAKDASQYFSNAEIVEMHHPYKQDAPSGTAIRTAQKMKIVKQNCSNKQNNSKEENTPLSRNPARGILKNNVPIHSVRLSGFFSQQSVFFGGNGEVLTIRHDGMDRKCMTSGIFIACRKVMALDHLVHGLENIL
ncbi:4-hydroxy-tetrahydrodipicolinate reductase [Coxiella endosymbiont of Amblyomma americanum]|uniref:4-hydroxy-tetrahydrodipicolinate reductase n=1 Tax=Coxiella endosymbiont of Amblyomma americanum TaxID=325775 RepID=UPI00057E6BA2|nr:4-hydroxy-tetrahydrodipicolinate reductase [Coxiella endosymbiont of Amblyomma americanum]AJC50213.1 dihydrodipicolinate reductase [Coxiella endosymbiont of Amblyomma americanum]